jgi:hypothetical protein
MTRAPSGFRAEESGQSRNRYHRRHIREVPLPLGFVDVKVCAVDETWSGLKLMVRRTNRKSSP